MMRNIGILTLPLSFIVCTDKDSILETLWNDLNDKLFNWKERETNLSGKHSKDVLTFYFVWKS